MKIMLLILAVLAVGACTEAKPEGGVTTETTAPAVSGQENTPKREVTTETTAAAVEPQGKAAPTANPAPQAANAPPPAAKLMADPAKDQPPGCERLDCPPGERCMLVEVQCIQAPCPPQPECRPETEASK